VARENAIEVEGVVVELLRTHTCQVELANGHRVRAFLTGKARLSFERLAVGEVVVLEISPYDLSVGRIIAAKQIGLSRSP